MRTLVILLAFCGPLLAQSLPGAYEKISRCYIQEGEVWPGGEIAGPRTNLHPRNWATDICVRQDSEDENKLHAWMNWPDPSRVFGTQIAHTTSEDGINWTIPQVVMNKTDVGPLANVGVETPSAAYHKRTKKWKGAALIKQFLEGQEKHQGRTDRIAFFDLPEGPSGRWVFDKNTPMLVPELDFEAKWYNKRRGYWDGGLQEPSLHWFADNLTCWYTSHQYGPNNTRPSTGLAVLLPGEEKWRKWPTPVIPRSGQIDVVVVDGGFRAYYQDILLKQIHVRTSKDGVHWSSAQFVLQRGSVGEWDDGRTVAPSVLGDRLWYLGSDEPLVGKRTNWFGLARETK